VGIRGWCAGFCAGLAENCGFRWVFVEGANPRSGQVLVFTPSRPAAVNIYGSAGHAIS
jgi:hypothetical protein